MREPIERDVNKNEILRKCLECLVKNGLENTSIKNFSDATEMSASSIYYWFKDKEEIVVDATKYGLNLVADELFGYVRQGIKNGDIIKLLRNFPDIIMKYKLELRFVYQVATSPQYGEKIRSMTEELDDRYDECAKKLSKQLNMPYKKLRVLISLITSVILDYIVWEEREKINVELDWIIHSLGITEDR